MEKHGCIYEITCIPTGKKYIGQTRKTVEHRWKQHTDYAFGKRKGKSKLANAIRKYGAHNFSHITLEECSVELLNDRETYWIACQGTLANGLNLNEGGKAPIWSAEAKQRFSETHPYRGKLGANHPAFGYKHTAETKQKIAAAQRGKKRSQDSIQKGANKIKGPNNFWYGKTISDDLKKKRSAPLKGRKRSANIMQNGLAAAHKANRGRIQSEEEKTQRSVALRGKPKSAEHRKKLSEAAKRRWNKNKPLL